MRKAIYTGVFIAFLSASCGAQALKLEVQSEGQVAICKDAGRDTYRLLDFWEGERFQPAFPRHEAWIFDKARWALNQVQAHHPELIERLGKNLKSLPSKIKHIPDTSHASLGESNRPPGMPLNCSMERVLYRNSGSEQKYSLRDDLFKRLPAEDQAGLILHILLVEDAMSHGGAIDYAQIRSVVRLWSQGGPGSLGLSRYVLGLRGTESVVGQIKINQVVYQLNSASPLRVHGNGQVASGVMVDEDKSFTYRSDNGFELEIASKRGPVKLSFHDTGVPKDALLKSEVVEIPIQGKKLKFKYEVSFHPNGRVQRGFFLSEYGLRLKMVDGRIRRFKGMEYHMGLFNEAGQLISARRLSNMNSLPEQLRGP